MYIGNIILLILNLPLIGIWVQILKVPYKILFPLILLFCLIGVYTVSNAVFDIYIMIAFGVVGYLMKKFEYEEAPLVRAFVLGPLFEVNLRKSLILSHGDFSIFFTKPLSAVSLIVALLLPRFSPDPLDGQEAGRDPQRGNCLAGRKKINRRERGEC